MRPRLNEDILSLSEFKRNTAAMVRRIKRTRRPLVLTVNGKPELIVQRPDEYEKQQARSEFEETAAAIREGLADVKAGRTMPLEDFLVRMRETVRR
jgi:PHD/YefM family antitoxin component YafN of YafNO toxin-antitoxin module